MLLYSPRWLFLVPGLVLLAIGLGLSVVLAFGNLKLGTVVLDVGTLAVACMTVIVGFQLVAFAFFTKVFGIAEKLLPEDPKLNGLFKTLTLEKGLVFGLLVLLSGMIMLTHAVWVWRQADFGQLLPADNLRRLIPAATLVVLGIQNIFSSFFMSVLGLKTVSRKPPGH